MEWRPKRNLGNFSAEIVTPALFAFAEIRHTSGRANKADSLCKVVCVQG
jgi:hypothetical protein